MKYLVVGVVVLIAVVAIAIPIGIRAIKSAIASSAYPIATNLPPAPETGIDEILVRLETVLAAHAPAVLESLQPGLGDAEIAALERGAGATLDPDLKALYSWRNGQVDVMASFVHIHRFVPLGESIANQTAFQQSMSEPGMFIVAYQQNWLQVFVDLSGDGIMIDLSRTPSSGAVFDVFLEDGSYTFFPSIKSVLLAICEVYETPGYAASQDGPTDQDIQVWMDALSKFGSDGRP